KLHHAKEAREALERGARLARSLRMSSLLAELLTETALVDLGTGDSRRALGTAQQALDLLETLLGGLGDEEGASARGQHEDLYAVGAIAACGEHDAAETFRFLESGRAGA